jgi:hypothetical protein
MCRICALVAALLSSAAIGLTATPAVADPDHPRCQTITIHSRADNPAGVSVRAVQEGLLYAPWCR